MIAMFVRVRHALAHWFQLNSGTVETRFEGDRLAVGFRCVTCFRLSRLYSVPRERRSFDGDQGEPIPPRS